MGEQANESAQRSTWAKGTAQSERISKWTSEGHSSLRVKLIVILPIVHWYNRLASVHLTAHWVEYYENDVYSSLLARLTHLLVPHCSLDSRAPLRSFVRSLALLARSAVLTHLHWSY